jgi:large subunit ribosomal protein L10
MNRREKELLIESLKERFSASQATFLIGVQGLTVMQLQKLRRNIRKNGGELKVVKNTLLLRASQGVPGTEVLHPYFQKQVAVIFAPTEVPGIARVVYEAAKELEKLSLAAGCFSGALIGQDKLQFLATLPPREQLLAMLCGGLKAPITNCVGLLNQLIVRLAVVLKNASEKQQ